MINDIENEAGNQRIKPIILVDKYKPQFFNFDQGLVVTERMVEKMLPVVLRLSEGKGVLNVSTSELSATKLRITAPKKSHIAEDEHVLIDFTSIYSKLNKEFFLKVPYQVIAIEEFSHVKHAVLGLSRNANSEFVAWLKQWLKENGQINKYEENNDKIFNCIFSYYKRLYTLFLAHPIIFSDEEGIKQAFLSNEAVNCIDFSNGQNANSRLSVNVFNEYINDQQIGTRIPLYVWYENNQFSYLTSADVPKISPKQIIAWLKSKEQWRVLLIRTRKVKVPESSQIEAIQKYTNEKILQDIEAFKESFVNITSVTSVLDISRVFDQIDLDWENLDIQARKHDLKSRGVSYSTLSFKMKRVEARFSYQTQLRIDAEHGGKTITIDAQSEDISMLGLSVKIPFTDFPFSIKDQIMVDFVDWNAELASTGTFFKKKQKLNPVEYIIKNVDRNDEYVLLGLFRHRRDADPGINLFIKGKLVDIRRDTAGVRRNDLDLYNSFYASVWLTNNIAGLPFFLGHDAEGIRIIQAIINTEENQILRKPFLANEDWSFLQQVATTLAVAIRDLQVDKSRPLKLLNCGIYCYFEENANAREGIGWKTQTDLDFATAHEKEQFVLKAIRHPKHIFYNCSLVSVKGYKDDILNSEVVEFMSKAAHRVKEMHSLCNSLLAIGELNEITRLIEFMYK